MDLLDLASIWEALSKRARKNVGRIIAVVAVVVVVAVVTGSVLVYKALNPERTAATFCEA